ncbi:MAG: diguanylate cyclase [Xenococcaceae cyanobacterium MO_188.B29]|nr:diguanylate cyclase [Xenococcaceae cyanobacterium MO_188.B29]
MKTESDKTLKGKILMVDDLPEGLRTLSYLLNNQGYKVICVANGEVAINLIQQELPDLVVLDIMLPVIDGYKVCQIIKANPNTSHIPVVFLSGLDSEYDKLQAFKVGAIDYITKPFFVEEVIARIETQLSCFQKQRELEKIIEEQVKERLLAEEKLNQSRALLSSVLNSSADGVAAFESIRDSQGQIVDFRWLVVNPVAAMTVGKTSDSLLYQPLYENQPGYIFDGLFDLFLQVVDNCIVLEKEHYCDSGQFKAWFHVVAVKLGDGFAMTFRDITEHKHMEIALKKANQELKHQANVDSLTQIANRRCFDEYLTQEWARCGREHQYLAIVLCDVDHFKAYNDTYGHQAGDECLTKVAQSMKLVVKRPADLVFRYGGEEFALILPNTNEKGALEVAEAIRQQIKLLKITHNASTVGKHVTLSLGVACTIPSTASSPEALIANADRALYEAKSLGRDRTICAGIELPLF